MLTAVGLLPIAVAGCDIAALMAGAARAQKELCDPDIEKNDCYKYAAARNALLRKGRARRADGELRALLRHDVRMVEAALRRKRGE